MPKLKQILSVCGVCGFSVAVIIFAYFFITSMPSMANTTSVKSDVYFVTLSQSGQFVAYVPDHSVNVNIKIDANVTKPYVEVAKITNKSKVWETNADDFTAWGLGGTLYVKDVPQLKELLLKQ